MKSTLKLLLIIKCYTAGEDIVKTIERDVSLSPAALIKGLNLFLEEILRLIEVSLWQASGMVEYEHIAFINIYVDEMRVHYAEITIPHNPTTKKEVTSAEKRIGHDLAEFRYASRDRIAVHIICSQKFIGQ